MKLKIEELMTVVQSVQLPPTIEEFPTLDGIPY